MQFGTRRRSRVLFKLYVLMLVALAAAVRFYQLSEPIVWSDEAFSVMLSRYSPGLIWFHTSHDIHPPLYYLLLHYWMMGWGDSPFAIRSMSALMGVGSVALGIWLARFVLTRKAALFAGLLLALLPISLRYSQEARMYALLAMLLMGATIALLYWVKEPGKQRFLAVYALLMVAGFYTHYFTVLCVLVHGCYLVTLKFRSVDGATHSLWPAWWLTTVAIVVAYLPWLYALTDVFAHLESLKSEGVVSWINESTLYKLPSAVWRTLIAEDGRDLVWPLYTLVPLIIMLMASRVVLKDKSRYQFFTGIIIYTCLPMLVTFMASLLVPMFLERYLIFSLMGLPIVLVLLLEQLRWKYVSTIILLFFVSLEIKGVLTIYVQMEGFDGNRNGREFPFAELTDHVDRHSMPGDRMVVSNGMWYLSMIYYNKLSALPQIVGRASSYSAATVLYASSSQVYLNDLDDLPNGSCRIWWVGTAGDGSIFPSGWRMLSEQLLGQLDVRLYQTAPNPTGENCPPPMRIIDPVLRGR